MKRPGKDCLIHRTSFKGMWDKLYSIPVGAYATSNVITIVPSDVQWVGAHTHSITWTGQEWEQGQTVIEESEVD